MPRPQSSASRTSLYRLRDVSELVDGVREKYLASEHFEVTPLQIQGRDALLVRGAMETPTVGWAAALHNLTGETIELGNITAAAVLLLRTHVSTQRVHEDVDDAADVGVRENVTDRNLPEDADGALGVGHDPDTEEHSETEGGDDHSVAWAVAYGMGFQLLDMSKVDPGFGQRIALRTADPRELNSLTRTTLDQRARTERASIPGGADLRGFGVSAFGELVTRLVARADISTITGGAKPIRLRGADALSVPLGKRPDQLVHDLDELAKILRRPVPDKELALLEQLVAVKQADALDELEDELAAALAAPELHRIGLSWPHERIDENGTPTSFRIHSGGRRFAGAHEGLPDLAAVLAPLEALAVDERLERLKRMHVQLFSDSDGEDAVSGAIPAIRWITFEHDQEGKRYCLHDGNWYLMNQDYAERLRVQVQAIFDRDAGISLPQWPSGVHEDGYNKLAARELGGVCLDKNLIRTDLHPRGIEVCDVLLPDGTPVHVKELSSSTAASHLLAQALVSTDALLYDEQAVERFREKVAKAGWNPDDLRAKPARVVLGIARKGKTIGAADLFTFTQVTLVRQTQVLGGRGVDVVVVPIERQA